MVSKLAEMEARVLLPLGEGRPEGPDEGAFPALTQRFAPPSPKGRGTCPKQERDYARQRGLRLIEWTYDPLESKNAHLNIKKLGAIVRRYYVNLYGEITSRLQQGLESDRVVAEWWIDQPRVRIEGDIRRVCIPGDIQALKQQSVASAKEVQRRVREEFLKNFQEDYFVAGFERKDEWSEYLFMRGASGVYQTD